MAKKSKLKTPEWILKGEKKPAEKKKQARAFKIRICPECSSDNVNVVMTGEEGKGTGEWECKKCRWKGRNIGEQELTEDEFMEYLDRKGEEVA